MIEAGTVSRNLVDALLELHNARKSGVLRFEKGSAKKQLVIVDGNLAYAESNLSEEHLAVLLMKMNRLPRSELARVTALMKEGKSSDEALLATQKIDKPVLEEGARAQALSIGASLFAWDDCEIRFYPGKARSQRQLNVAIPLTEFLVLASKQAAHDRLVPPALLKLEGMVTQAGSEARFRLNLPLDNLAGMVYSLAQDRMPVNQFLALMPPGTNKPEELLLCLLLLGLLRLEAAARDKASDQVSKPESTLGEGLTQRVVDLLDKYEVANHYEILSVPTDASEEQIKSSYHDLAREFHPDRFQSQEHTPEFRSQVEKLFTYITGAYTVLSDPASRASYDTKRLKEGSKVEAAQEARSGVDRESERMVEALYRSARKKIQDGKYEEAVSLLKECVWSRPDEIRYQLYLGIAETEVPRLRKSAEQRLLKAVEMDPMRLDTRLALGKLYIKVNLPRRAEALFHEVLRWDPDNPEANKLMQIVSKLR